MNPVPRAHGLQGRGVVRWRQGRRDCSGTYDRTVRVWVDFTNTAHVQVLRPLVELLEEHGHEVEMTARPLSQTVGHARALGTPAEVIGHHGGARRIAQGGRRGLARAGAPPLGESGATSTTGSRTARPTCRWSAACCACRTRRCSTTSGPSAQHHVNCRLATRVLVPDAIPRASACAATARGRRSSSSTPGLKEEYFLADFEPDRVGARPGSAPTRRTSSASSARRPSYALYLGGSENPLLPRLLERISQADGAQAVVIARTPEQADAIDALRYPGVLVPARDGRRPQPGRARRPARLGRRHDEPRGRRAGHAGVVDLRGQAGRGGRAA